MKKIVLILGGYGVFGKIIAKALSKENNIELIIAGRNLSKAFEFASSIGARAIETDININLEPVLFQTSPFLVINCCGPFQDQNYEIPLICINHKIHYIDLADAREYVANIKNIDLEAKKNKVSIIAGASTVPALSSAVIEKFKSKFSQMDSLTFGVTPGAKAPRGLATTKSILSYLGKKLTLNKGDVKNRYGWQDLYLQQYPELGGRLMSNCDIPDLELFPKIYGFNKIRFSAGMESKFLHLSMWVFSWLIRLGLPINLKKYSSWLLKLSKIFDYFGSANGGMHMIIEGKNHKGENKKISWFIIAYNDGPNIPTIPAIILTKKLVNNNNQFTGSMACMGLITYEEYMDELKSYNIKEIIIEE